MQTVVSVNVCKETQKHEEGDEGKLCLNTTSFSDFNLPVRKSHSDIYDGVENQL